MSRILGVDYGTKRIGLAISDGIGLTARPLSVVPRDRLAETVGEIASEYAIDLVVIGLPTGLGGEEGTSASGARELGAELARLLDVDVEYMDERFTSRIAEEVLLESGMKRRERKDTVDKLAAAIILQSYLDRHRREGNSPEPPGVESPGIQ